jgi:hypothetical protein
MNHSDHSRAKWNKLNSFFLTKNKESKACKIVSKIKDETNVSSSFHEKINVYAGKLITNFTAIFTK